MKLCGLRPKVETSAPHPHLPNPMKYFITIHTSTQFTRISYTFSPVFSKVIAANESKYLQNCESLALFALALSFIHSSWSSWYIQILVVGWLSFFLPLFAREPPQELLSTILKCLRTWARLRVGLLLQPTSVIVPV